jgi:6,7-dimethyl-8-ribityllumazine synthase
MHTEKPSQKSIHADPSWRIAIIQSSFYPEETDAMVREAKDALLEAGIHHGNISVHAAPGSFEIPLIGAAIAEKKTADALLGIGIIVEGETHHADLLAGEVARGIMDVQLRYRIPFAFEVLYVSSLEMARMRASKGAEAARAAINALGALAALQEIG